MDVVRQERQDRSFWLILPGFIVVFYASPLEYLYLPEVLPFAAPAQCKSRAWIAFCQSAIIHGWARSTLKGMYSGRVRVKAGHTLVQQGPYQIIRHPAYASFIIMSLGISIGYSSLIGLLAFPFLLLPRVDLQDERGRKTINH